MLLRDHGIDTASPKTALQEAYRLSLIGEETTWIARLRDRNLSSHTWREALAREMFARLPAYLVELERVAHALK